MRTRLYDLHGYGHPANNQPQWYVGYLTFQAGNVRQRTGSLTGGGFLYKHDNPGTFRPVIVLHTGPTNSLLGGGQFPWNQPFLTGLGQNPSGNNNGN